MRLDLARRSVLTIRGRFPQDERKIFLPGIISLRLTAVKRQPSRKQ